MSSLFDAVLSNVGRTSVSLLRSFVLDGRDAARSTASSSSLRGINEVGSGLQVFGSPRIQNQGFLRVGRDVAFHSTHTPIQLVVAPNARLLIGDESVLGDGVHIEAARLVQLGARVRLGAHVRILGRRALGAKARYEAFPSPVVIEDDVRIGARARICSGVRIGRGAVVAPFSVVSSDVPAYAIVGGPSGTVVGYVEHPAQEEFTVDHNEAYPLDIAV